MEVFKDYSRYYNLLYKDKDYNAEAEYVLQHLKKHNPAIKTILNLGCGTGNHDFIFSGKDLVVTGIDLSEDMITIANNKKQKLNKKNVDFFQGDIREIELNKTFDAVISLFHVMSYQVTNNDLEKTLQVAYSHLKNGGIFLFDFWYGPGVLTDRPTIRNKTFEDETFKVTRLSTPKMHFNENVVDVNFHVDIENKETNAKYAIDEIHNMRYFFIPELKYIIQKNGFDFILAEEWLSSNELTDKSWNATIICKK